VGLAMQKRFAQIGLDADLFVSEINRIGPKILD
jgi:hypothetical protein